MSNEKYVCLECVHLKPSHDLMECELQVVRHLKEDKSSWCYDPVCIHDAECSSRKYNLVHFYNQDISNYNTENNLTDRFQAK
jgi:hypothetical protein